MQNGIKLLYSECSSYTIVTRQVLRSTQISSKHYFKSIIKYFDIVVYRFKMAKKLYNIEATALKIYLLTFISSVVDTFSIRRHRTKLYHSFLLLFFEIITLHYYYESKCVLMLKFAIFFYAGISSNRLFASWNTCMFSIMNENSTSNLLLCSRRSKGKHLENEQW